MSIKKKNALAKWIKEISVIVLLLGINLPQANAYEPVVYKKEVNLLDDGLCPNAYICDFERLGSIPDSDKDMDSVVFTWPYLFKDNQADYFCNEDTYEDGAADRGFWAFRIETDADYSAFDSNDTLRLKQYELYFSPLRAGLTLRATVRPKLLGAVGQSDLTYEMPLMDTFRNVYAPDNPICVGKGTDARAKIDRVHFELYLNAYNSYIVVRLPQNPMGQVLSTPIRVGLGKYMMNQLLQNGDGLKISFNTADTNYPPSFQQEIDASLFYWTAKKGSAYTHPSRRNLADDINLFYGANAYPVRSPVLDRTRAAAAIPLLF